MEFGCLDKNGGGWHEIANSLLEHRWLFKVTMKKVKCCYKMWQASLATKCQNIIKVSFNEYNTSSAFTVV